MSVARVARLVVLVGGLGASLAGCHTDSVENGNAAGGSGGTADAGATSAGMPAVMAGSETGGAVGDAGEAATMAGASSTAGGVGSAGAPMVVECTPVGEMPIAIAWGDINTQPAAFYVSPEAHSLAENILYYQNEDDGWPKNVDMTTRTPEKAKSTIDNRGTTTQIEYLAKMFNATGCASYRDAAKSGVEALLTAQYENGGWPQYLTESNGYQKHITFNDDAIVHVLQLLRAVAAGWSPYGFFDEALKNTAGAATAKGIDCILACQVHMDGDLRGWCAQHDEVTLEPAQARTYELPSLSGSEGAGITRFLMTIDPPTPEIRAAIEGAIAWFQAVKLTGIRVESIVDATQASGEDRVVVEDAKAPWLWARFYELSTSRPIFSSRCEVPECETDPWFMRRYSLAEIDNERRVGYSWYGNWPAAALLEYAAWKKRYP
jgi:PelA/Pel-15E family pectate lyase